MDVITAIEERFSARAFIDKPIDKTILEKILKVASRAPSGKNTQPWQVAVLLDKALRQNLAQEIIASREAGIPENPDYKYYPTDWHEPYNRRRINCGIAMYKALDIKREDREKRKALWEMNYHFFHAPVGLIIYLERVFKKGSWLDTGMFIENILLTARGFGLEACPQASLAEYPDIVRKVLNIADSYAIVCGIALGYPDLSHPVNNYRTERASLEGFVKWYE